MVINSLKLEVEEKASTTVHVGIFPNSNAISGLHKGVDLGGFCLGIYKVIHLSFSQIQPTTHVGNF